MSNQNFIDYVKLYCRSGNGGAGSSHFFRTRSNPRGGPDGGDGGRGGHIILKGNRNVWTLLKHRLNRHVRAGHGSPGGPSRSTGANGADKYLEVPLGTLAYDAQTGELLAEVLDHDAEVILLPGGKGGKGNSNFATSTNQAPQYAQPGIQGIETEVILELKVLADVGLVGFPNAGKSTLLAAISAAKPKIADYAFTTMVPSLGIVSYRDDKSFVMADIPGIIENAHLGKGLGIRFLRHIERNSVLLYMVPCDADDIKKDYEILRNELIQFNPELIDKEHILGLSKADLIDEEIKSWLIQELPETVSIVFFSAVTGEGISELKDKIWGLLHNNN